MGLGLGGGSAGLALGFALHLGTVLFGHSSGSAEERIHQVPNGSGTLAPQQVPFAEDAEGAGRWPRLGH